MFKQRSVSFDLAFTKAAGADGNGLVCSVNDNADFTDVRLPRSACFAVGMGNIVSESDALAAVHTFCHLLHLLLLF